MPIRCFVIVVIAVLAGCYFQFQAHPSEQAIQWRISGNESARHVNKELNEMFRGRNVDYVEKDPYALDSGYVTASYVSFGVAGVVLLVGFIIGPPKKASSVPPAEES